MTGLEEIYQTYFHDVYRFLLRLSRDEQVAEELTSQTFFKAMEGLPRFRGDCQVRVWLCQIAKNCYYSHVRQQSRTDPLDEVALAALPGEEDSPEQQCQRRETARQVREVLRQLPQPYQEVFLWRALAELSFKEIGQMFHKSDNWACVTYHRAKNMMRKGLEDSTR